MLEKKRKEIELVDRHLVSLLQKRCNLSVDIGTIKKQMGMNVYDPTQEARVYACIKAINNGKIDEKNIVTIYREILSVSCSLQKPLTIACLGPKASFSHLASQLHFGKSADFVFASDINTIFKMVEKGKACFGVVPIENSLEGSVNITMDNLAVSNLYVVAERYLPIVHCLLSNSNDIKKNKKVYSHPQALAQCRGWIEKNIPKARLVEVESTSIGAQKATQEVGAGAIASHLATQLYNLNNVAEGIEDSATNTTRFFIIGKDKNIATDNNKTSLIFGASHKPGSLYDALKPFAARKINLMRVESRPMKARPWEYVFFIDFEGQLTDQSVRECISALEKKASFLRILGSYKQGEKIL